MPAHLRVPRVLRTPQAPEQPQRRPAEMAGSLLLAAVFNGAPRAQPSFPAELGGAPGGADSLCCLGGTTEMLQVGLFFAGWFLLIAPIAAVEGARNLLRDVFRKRKRENHVTASSRPPMATEPLASTSALPPRVETTWASAPSRKRSLSTESSGASALRSQAFLPEASPQTPMTSTVDSKVGQRREEAAFRSDGRDVLFAKAFKWENKVSLAPPRESRGTAEDAAAAAWPAWLDPEPLRRLWTAADTRALEEIMEVMESPQPCGKWKQPFHEMFETFLRNPSNPACQQKMLKILTECWIAVGRLTQLVLASLLEEQRKPASSCVDRYFVVDATADTSAAAIQAIAALCDVYRAAVSLKRAEEAAKQLLEAVAQAPAS